MVRDRANTTEQAEPEPDLSEIRRKSVRGGAVTLVTQVANTLLQLCSTVVLARLLSPDDYGTLAMVVALTSFAGLFRELGLSAAAVQRATLSHEQVSNLFWINAVSGLVLTVVVAAAAPLVAWFYSKPELVPLTILLSSTFAISSLGTQHGALLQRNLQFGRKAISGTAGAACSFIIAIILALQGMSYWSIAWGTVGGALVTTVMLWVLSPFRPSGWHRSEGTGSLLRFGASITAFDVVNYFHRNLDNILIGHYWGEVALGLYSKAYALLMFPIQAIRGPINAVAMPAMSRLQNHPEGFRAYYCKIISILALLSMPLTAFLGLEAQVVIEVALGKNWTGIAPIFSILSIVAFIQPAASLRGLILMSLGQGKRYAIWGMINAAAVVAGFLAGLPWGPAGVATGYAVSTYLILQPSMIFTLKNSPIRTGDFWRSILRPTTSSLGAAAILFLARPYFPAFELPLVELIVKAAAYFILFAFIHWLLPGGRREIEDGLSLLRSLKRSSRTETKPA